VFSEERFLKMNGLELQNWVGDNFSQTLSVSSEPDGSDVYVFRGTSDELGEFLANVHIHNDHIILMSLHNVQNGPSFNNVVMGLGEPVSVYHYCSMPHDPLLYNIGLDYPTMGVSVFASESKPRRSLVFENGLGVVLREDMQVNLIKCYQPALTMEEVIERDRSLTSSGKQLQLQNRMPWSGFGSIVPLTIP